MQGYRQNCWYRIGFVSWFRELVVHVASVFSPHFDDLPIERDADYVSLGGHMLAARSGLAQPCGGWVLDAAACGPCRNGLKAVSGE